MRKHNSYRVCDFLSRGKAKCGGGKTALEVGEALQQTLQQHDAPPHPAVPAPRKQLLVSCGELQLLVKLHLSPLHLQEFR